MIIRWVAVLAALVVVACSGGQASALWGVPLAVVALLRTVEHVRPVLGRRSSVWISLAAELAVAGVVVDQSGGWHSGWVLVLVAEAALAGCLIPSRWAGSVASAGIIALVVVNLAGGATIAGARPATVDLDCLLVAAALATAYGSWLIRHGDTDRAVLAQANERLMATNDLLVLLDRRSLGADDVTDPQQAARTVARMARELLDPEVVVVATGVGESWRVLLSEGVTLAAMVDELDVLSLAGSAGEGRPIAIDVDGPLLSGDSASGVCIPLSVRGRLVGALVLEHSDRDHWDEHDLEVMAELGSWASLLVDNACRFNAMWIVGAADERTRIARDLHDHLGQNMAAVGLQLDGVARQLGDPGMADQVRQIRAQVTAMVADLRFTMRDLCCDVTEDKDLAEVLDELVRRLAHRSEAAIDLTVEAGERLPVTQEHQLLQIARSLLAAAVTTRASRIAVRWSVDGDRGRLEVEHDGSTSAPGGLYEVAGTPMLETLADVRDRCWAAGATFGWDIEAAGACVVRCEVAR